MFDLLVNPDGFFRERADDPPALPPVLVVLAVGLLGGASAPSRRCGTDHS